MLLCHLSVFMSFPPASSDRPEASLSGILVCNLMQQRDFLVLSAGPVTGWIE